MWGGKKSQELSLFQLKMMFDQLRDMEQTKLDLCRQEQLGDDGLKHLVDVLLKSPRCQLRKLDLNATGLTNAAIPPLFEGLAHAKSVDYVDLRGNLGIDEEGCRAVERRCDRGSSGHPDVLSTTRLTFNHPCYLQPHDLPSATQATVERARHSPLASVVRASNVGLHRVSARNSRTDTIFGLVITL